MPAASSSSTSCQRLAWREPGALVWASSSTRSSAGWRARARVEIELLERPCRGSRARWRGRTLQPLEQAGRLGAAVGLDDADDDVEAFGALGAGGLEHGEGLPDAGRGAEEDLELAAARSRRLGLDAAEQRVRDRGASRSSGEPGSW